MPDRPYDKFWKFERAVREAIMSERGYAYGEAKNLVEKNLKRVRAAWSTHRTLPSETAAYLIAHHTGRLTSRREREDGEA